MNGDCQHKQFNEPKEPIMKCPDLLYFDVICTYKQVHTPKCPDVGDLKVACATFLLLCFVNLKESICETRKNVSYFTLKALFVLEIIKF